MSNKVMTLNNKATKPAFVLALATILSCFPTTLIAAPKLVCSQPAFDFGVVKDGHDVSASFTLRNEGDEPLKIVNVFKQCGCTMVDLPAKEIPSQGQVVLSAKLSLKLQKGKIDKSITVESNDPLQPKHVFHIIGEVVPVISVSPYPLQIGLVNRHVGTTRTIQLKMVVPDRRFRVLGVTVDDPKAISVHSEEIEKGKHYQLSIAIAKPLPAGVLDSTVQVLTDDPQWGSISIPVIATLTEPIAVKPSKLNVIKRTDGKSVLVYLTVTSPDGQPFRITSVEVPKKSIETKIIPSSDTAYRIKISNLRASDELNNKSIVIKTDVKELEELRVPLTVVNPVLSKQHKKGDLP